MISAARNVRPTTDIKSRLRRRMLLSLPFGPRSRHFFFLFVAFPFLKYYSRLGCFVDRAPFAPRNNGKSDQRQQLEMVKRYTRHHGCACLGLARRRAADVNTHCTFSSDSSISSSQMYLNNRAHVSCRAPESRARVCVCKLQPPHTVGIHRSRFFDISSLNNNCSSASLSIAVAARTPWQAVGEMHKLPPV
jgi:hypothetical protein